MIFMTIGVMVNKLAFLCVNILLARFSSTETYGVFALLRNTVNMVETTLSSSVTPVVVKMSGREYGEKQSFGRTNSLLLLISLALVIIVSIPLWLLADPISVALFDQQKPDYVRLGLLMLIMTNASGVIASLLVTGRVTKFLPAASIAAAPVGVIFAWFYVPEAPVIASIVALILIQSTEFILKIGVAIWKKVLSLEGVRTPPQDILGVFTSSLAILVISSAINAIAFWLLRFLLVDTTGDFTPLAQFDVAFQYLAVEMMVINNAVTIFQSRSVRAQGANTEEGRRTYRTGVQLTAIITALACATNLVCAQFLIGIYGAAYDPQLLRALTAVLPVYAVSVFFNRLFVNEGKPIVLLLVSSLSSIVALAYAALFMENAYGLVWSFVIYFTISNLVYLGCVITRAKIKARESEQKLGATHS